MQVYLIEIHQVFAKKKSDTAKWGEQERFLTFNVKIDNITIFFNKMDYLIFWVLTSSFSVQVIKTDKKIISNTKNKKYCVPIHLSGVG